MKRDADRTRVVLDIEKLNSALNLIHRQLAEHATTRRDAAVEAHNRRTGVRKINFETRDYASRAKGIYNRGVKLSLKWNMI